MARVRVQRLQRLLDESRPSQHATEGHLSVKKLHFAYEDICFLAETSLIEFNAGI